MNANFSGLLLAAQASQQPPRGRQRAALPGKPHDAFNEEEERLAKKFRSTPRTDEERKSRHREVERRRTRRMNTLIDQLRSEIEGAGRTVDNNKASVLAASIDLIHNLRSEISTLKAGGAIAGGGSFSGRSSTSVSGDDSDHAYQRGTKRQAAVVASASDAGVAQPATKAGGRAKKAAKKSSAPTLAAIGAAAQLPQGGKMSMQTQAMRFQQLRQVHQMLQYQQLQQQQMQQMQQMAIWRSQQLQMQQMQQMQQGVLAQGAGLPQVYPQGAWPAAALAQQQQQLQRRVVAATAAKTAGTPPPPPSPPIFPTAMGAKSAV
tara:strand:- start:1884 stop:2840 length:957 start_codon:yes stop_codon:yes gene_type:complete